MINRQNEASLLVFVGFDRFFSVPNFELPECENDAVSWKGHNSPPYPDTAILDVSSDLQHFQVHFSVFKVSAHLHQCNLPRVLIESDGAYIANVILKYDVSIVHAKVVRNFEKIGQL